MAIDNGMSPMDALTLLVKALIQLLVMALLQEIWDQDQMTTGPPPEGDMGPGPDGPPPGDMAGDGPTGPPPGGGPPPGDMAGLRR